MNIWGGFSSCLIRLLVVSVLGGWPMSSYAGDPCDSDPYSSACQSSGGSGSSGGGSPDPSDPPASIDHITIYGANDTSEQIIIIPLDGLSIPIVLPSKDRDGYYSIVWGAAPGTIGRYDYRESYNGDWGAWVGNEQNTRVDFANKADGDYQYEVRTYTVSGGYGAAVLSDKIIVEKDGRLPPIIDPVNSICTEHSWTRVGFSMEDLSAPSDDVDGNFSLGFSWSQGSDGSYKPTRILIQESRNDSVFYDLAEIDVSNEQTATSASYAISNRPAANYRYRVQGRSQRACGSNIEYSNTVTVHSDSVAPSTLTTPSELSCDVTSLSVTWNTVGGSNQYQLQRSVVETDADGNTINTSAWQTILDPSTNQPYFVAQTYIDTDIAQGRNYRYRVSSRFQVQGTQEQTNWSDWQYSVERRKPFCAPEAPSKVFGNSDAENQRNDGSNIIDYIDWDGHFALQWDYSNNSANSVVGYYEIYRRGTLMLTVDNTSETMEQAHVIEETVGDTYRYYVVACNVDGCSQPSDYWQVTVALPAEAPEIPLPFSAVNDPDGGVKQIYNGILQGGLSVSPSGAANYSLPVAMPPGTAGIAPKLSLDYSSQSGNGLLGVGWSLGGLSMIARCPKTIAQDQARGSINYDNNDRFCLDGKRLVVVEGEYGAPGSVYRTEIDSFDIVTAIGTKGSGPAWFEVKTKSGEKLQYGNTAESQVEAEGKQTVSAWAMNQVEDTVGNYYTVDYYEGTDGEFYPTAFHYTGNSNEVTAPYATVDLVYEARPDMRNGYYLGSKSTQSKRLKKIVTLLGEYQLEYADANDFQASRIAAIQYCDTNNVCPSSRRLTFDWQENNGHEGWEYGPAENTVPYQFNDADGNSFYTQFADIDGDGRIEMISGRPARYVSGSEPCIKACDSDPSNPSGIVPATLMIMSSLGRGGPGWEPYPGPMPAVSPYVIKNAAGETMDSGMRLADLNGDGFVDILQSREAGPTSAWIHGPQRGDGWVFDANYASPEPFIDNEGQDRGTRILDLNGDGLPDILRLQIIDYYNGHHRAWINNGHGWDATTSWVDDIVSIATDDKGLDEGVRFADLNGDGLVDMMVRDGNVGNPDQRLTYINTGSDFERQSYGGYSAVNAVFVDEEGQDQGLRLVDLNGDGLPDLMSAKAGYNEQQGYRSWINTGDNWIETQEYRAPMPFIQVFQTVAPDNTTYDTYVDYGARLLDVNGDGLTDIIQRGTAGTGRVVLNTGSGWNEIGGSYSPRESMVKPAVQTEYNPYDVQDYGVRFADIDSDGQVDFVANNENWNRYNVNRAKPLLIRAIRDGLGNEQNIHYKVLTDPAVYELEDNVQGIAHRDVRLPMQVVYQVDTPDGRGAPQTQEYFYKGLVFNTQGLGSYGFREIKITNLTTNFYNVTTYYQEYPYVGIPKSSISKTGSGHIISETYTDDNDLAYKNPLGTSHGFTVKGDISGVLPESEKVYVPVFPYIAKTETTIHHFDNAMNPVGTSATTRTQTAYDEQYGNVTQIIVDVDNNQGDIWRTVTDNSYDGDGVEHERMGRLTRALVTKTAAGETSYRETTFDYDDSTHLLIKEFIEPNRLEPESLATVYQHDAFGNRISVTVCAQNVLSCTAEDPGQSPIPNRITRTSYEPSDNPDVTAERGRFPVATTNALGHRETYHYDGATGLITQQTGPNGLTTCYEYDSWGRKVLSRNLCGSVIETQTKTAYYWATTYTDYAAYTVESFLLGQEDATKTRSYYDAQGRELRTLSRGFKGQIVQTDNGYDERGRLVQTSAPYFYRAGQEPVIYWTTSVLDDLERIQSVLQPVGDLDNDQIPDTPVTVATTFNGFETRVTGALGRTKVTYKNALGQTTKTIDAYGTVNQSQIVYQYDSQGHLKTTTDSNNNIVEMGYDLRGRKIWMKDPDMSKQADTQWSYSYNGYGELIQQTDSKGQVTQMEYDVLGRMISRTDLYETAQAQTSTWHYDTAEGAGIGRLFQEIGQYATKEQRYDQYGRLASSTQILTNLPESGSFTTEWRYDKLGRTTHIKYPEVNSSKPRVWMNYHYNQFGYLHYIVDITDPANPSGEVYWRADELSVRGQVELEQHRNRTQTTQYYNDATGWLDSTFTMDGTEAANAEYIHDNLIQHTTYVYDESGNVQSKTGRANGLDRFENDLTEHYEYDHLDRLTSTGIEGKEGGIIANGVIFGVGENANYPSKQFEYNVLGNMTLKSDVGTYLYGDECANSGAGPHAVCKITSGNVTLKSYQYDANGSMTSSYSGEIADNTPARSIIYTPFNKPSKITDHLKNTDAEFYYGADRARVFRVADEIVNTGNGNYQTQRERIAFVGHGATGGALMQRKTNSITRRVTYTHYIYANGYHEGQAFAMRVMEENAGVIGYVGTEFYHRDHLGSVIAITDDTGLKRGYDPNMPDGVSHTFLKGYDAWGKRRNPNWSEDPSGETQYTSVRGHLSYTGQEAITGVGLIHMNGRVYDPELGRFLSADPYIQSEGFSQSYNRYSYVMNNPVNSTDPSGYFAKKLLQAVDPVGWELKKATLPSISPKTAAAISMGLNYIPVYGPLISAHFSADYAAINGASDSQILHSYTIAVVSSYIGQGISNPILSGAVSGAFSGAMNAAYAGENIRRGFFQGAARGAAVAAVVWGIQNSVSNRTTEDTNAQLDVRETIDKVSNSESSPLDDAGTVGNVEVTDITSRLVYAQRDGTIISTDWQNPNDHSVGVGFRVVIDTGDGFADIYGHLDPSVLVPAVGSLVGSGDVIGLVADPTNGHSSAPHLHFGRQMLGSRVFIDPGSGSPLRNGAQTSPWNSIDNWHNNPHTGRDFGPRPRSRSDVQPRW